MKPIGRNLHREVCTLTTSLFAFLRLSGEETSSNHTHKSLAGIFGGKNVGKSSSRVVMRGCTIRKGLVSIVWRREALERFNRRIGLVLAPLLIDCTASQALEGC